jgi:hypothetical protein
MSWEGLEKKLPPYWNGNKRLPVTSLKRGLPMIVKLDPASTDRTVWMLSVRVGDRDVPVDFTRVHDERSFVGDRGGVFVAECESEGWRIIAPAGA